ncbi:hypothetical protein [Plantactinospora sp. B5E13]|uniref:hypothetical protein n=1 Tax=Plantactinospora sp. B5E13 TaxID=3153758 RepID=UPI00325E953C
MTSDSPAPASPRVQTGCAGPVDAWLLPRLQMRFRPVSTAADPPVARLGGQPAWLATPTWPLSRALNSPMRFVGQFPVPGPESRIAYLFVADDDNGMVETFEPEAGENALLVQPGGVVPDFVTVTDAATGPSLWRRGATWQDRVPVQLAVDLTPMDPAAEAVLDAEIDRRQAEDGDLLDDLSDLDGSATDPIPPYSYLGGRMHLWQPHLPQLAGDWRFFFQLDGGEGQGPDDPYALNFGGGTGYALLSPDRREGRFFWDCV